MKQEYILILQEAISSQIKIEKEKLDKIYGNLFETPNASVASMDIYPPIEIKDLKEAREAANKAANPIHLKLKLLRHLIFAVEEM